MVSVFSGKSDEELVKKYISWFLPDKKPKEKPGEEDTSEEQKPGEEVSGDGEGLVSVVNSNDFLTLKNIKCYDHKGKVMEQYDELIVAKDVVRHATEKYEGKNLNEHISFAPYNAIAHFDKQKSGLFLPSFALLSNVVVALFDKAVKKDKDGNYKVVDNVVNNVLMQFKNYGDNSGWHNCNTVVDWGHRKIIRWSDRKIIHYPGDGDFPEYGGSDNINSSRKRKEYIFVEDGFDNLDLEDALKKSGFRNYLIDLTGLKDPSILCDVADYFGKTASNWIFLVGKTRGTHGALLGCSSNDHYFELDTCTSLDSNFSAARGVGAGGTKKP